MPPNRHAKTASSEAHTPQRSRGKNALSQKRLRSMIEKGQSLHNSSSLRVPKPEFDKSDLRTEAEKAALLLWVSVSPCVAAATLTQYVDRQMSIMSVRSEAMKRCWLSLIKRTNSIITTLSQVQVLALAQPFPERPGFSVPLHQLYLTTSTSIIAIAIQLRRKTEEKSIFRPCYRVWPTIPLFNRPAETFSLTRPPLVGLCHPSSQSRRLYSSPILRRPSLSPLSTYPTRPTSSTLMIWISSL